MSSEHHWLELLRYEGDRTATAYRSGLSSADTTNSDSLGAISVYSMQVEAGNGLDSGKTTLLVHGRFSASTGATSIWVARCFANTYGPPVSLANTVQVVAVEPVTSIVSASPFTAAGKYFSSEVVVDVFGCQFVKVMIGAVNTGTVDLYCRRI